MDPKDAWRRKVQALVDEGDRDAATPRFVGRGHLFDLLESMVRSSRQKPPSRTIVVSGAPGAGKSAFVEEVAARCAGRDDVVTVKLAPPAFTPGRLAKAVSKALGVVPDAAGDTVAGGEIGVAGFGKLRREQRTHRPAGFDAINDEEGVPWDVLRGLCDRAQRTPVIVLLCDEAQNLNHRRRSIASMVQTVHEGDTDDAPVPLVPVFAGLNDTMSTLSQCGVSRLLSENRHALGAFPRDESETFAKTALDHIEAGGTPDERARWEEWLVANGDGWPQHLRIHVRAIAKEMLRVGSPQLSSLDTETIARNVSEGRDGFYGDRLDATRLAHLGPVFREMAERADPPTSRSVLLAIAAESCGDRVDPGAMVDAALHAGILQSKGRDRYECPIPSMRQWLRTRKFELPPLAGIDQTQWR